MKRIICGLLAVVFGYNLAAQVDLTYRIGLVSFFVKQTNWLDAAVWGFLIICIGFVYIVLCAAVAAACGIARRWGGKHV
jgi:hypothetical protein